MINTLNTINDSIKDCLLIIDRDLIDQSSAADLFERINKIIIATTLLARILRNSEGSQGFVETLNNHNLHLLGLLKLISRSVKDNEITKTRDLIRFDLRDSLIMWIIQTIPQLRTEVTDQTFGSALNLESNLRN